MDASNGTGAVLATAEEIEAETIALQLLADPELIALQAQLRAELAATPTGRMPTGAARLDEVVAQWTTLLVIHQIDHYRPAPTFLWTLNDSPRAWHGHTVPASGAGATNPDNVYRMAYLEGDGQYEVTGQIDLAHRPAQLTFEVYRGDPTQPAADWLETQDKDHADFDNAVGMITDRDLGVGPDGRFSFTLGGPEGGPNHVKLRPGVLTVLVRDTFSDWANQRPSRIAIRRLDPTPTKTIDVAEIRRHVLADLPGYLRWSSGFPPMWFGGLTPNGLAGPIPRDRNWGFNAGLRFELGPDEAILTTIARAGADYMAVQALDPWMLAPADSRRQTSLNQTQSVADPDGDYSYVICPSDPGVANWLDSGGPEGFAVLRWQGMPPGVSKDELLREFKVIKLTELAALPQLAKVSPAERKAQLAERARTYDLRMS